MFLSCWDWNAFQRMFRFLVIAPSTFSENGLLSLRGDVLTRGHRYKVMQEHCTNNYRKNFFVQRGTAYRRQLLILVLLLDSDDLCTKLISVFSLVFNCTCFRLGCRVSGLVPFGYLRRLPCSCYHCSIFIDCMTMRSLNK